ncbi:MAG: ADP-forming succinate--CoA ligase subunit beta [Betaproteobacteria bacterium]|nr:MAG: ADP-forming succinate--CoA ligase subunit beta [Betaproteobacteria bacterium]
MKIHEYQGKQILREFGVPVPRGIPAFSVDEAVIAAQELGGSVWVVKAQIHAGGRGKGGGVKVAKSIEQVREYATAILGMQLITHQTSAAGQKVRRLFVEEGANIAKELYVSMVVDRGSQRIALLASSEGGMDIEEVAHSNPDAIKKVFIDPGHGLTDAQCDDISGAIGIPAASFGEARKCLQGLYKAFIEKDASLAEINPLIVSGDGKVIALDAKFNFDSNALFRHPDIVAMRDLDEEDPAEIEASKFDLAYISLDGDIGCLVNGAGLAMSTMDTIKLYGGEPANFLDVGGGATTEKVTEAFKIMLKNPNLKAILVNIFGGIMKCDTIAEGVIAASKAVGLKVPLVVRMKGTNEELGRKMLAESGLPIISANNMGEAAEKVVAAAKAYKPAAVAAVATAATAATAAVGAAGMAGVSAAGNAAAVASTAATAAVKTLEPSAPAAGWMKWLVLVIAAILAALLLRQCTQKPEAPKPVEPPKPVAAPVVEAPKAVLPSFGKWAANVAGDKLSLEGMVKDQGAKDAILGAAKAAFGDANVADKLSLDAALPAFAFGGKWPDIFGWLKGRAASLAFEGAGVKVSGEMGDAIMKDAEAKLKSALGEGVNWTSELKAKTMAAAEAFKAGAKSFKLDVEFDTGSAKIRGDDVKELNELAALIKDGKTKGEIGGHTDNVGQPESNQKLSQARAESVAAYLVAKGVPKDVLTAKGYGDTKPVAANDTPENKQRNRRVEFVAQ